MTADLAYNMLYCIVLSMVLTWVIPVQGTRLLLPEKKCNLKETITKARDLCVASANIMVIHASRLKRGEANKQTYHDDDI